MTAKSSTILRWIIRFLVAAACYAGINTIWVNNGVGWDRLNLFVAAFAFGAILFLCWCVAIAIEHFTVPKTWVRLIVHPLIVSVLFAAASAVVLTQFFGDPAGSMWRETQPYVILAAACALIDAALDMLLEGKLTPVPRIAS